MNSRIKCYRGFTLLEILIAILIFAVVISTLFSSFKAFIISSEGVKKDVLQKEKINNIYKRINLDLESMFVLQPPRYKKPGFDADPDLYGFIGNEETLGQDTVSSMVFTSLAHAKFGDEQRSGVARIAYYVREDENSDLELCRADMLPPFTQEIKSGADPILCRNIQDFEILYYDYNGDEYSNWDSEIQEFHYTFPSKIDLKITFGTKEQPQIYLMSFDIIPGRLPIE